MGRRSIHTHDELRELIVQAATDIVDHDGLTGLSAREIAKRVNYSPGTLYNVFDNLDELLLTIEARLLDRLARRLGSVDSNGTPQQRLCQLADAYLEFTQENPKLWNLLLEHRLPTGREVPDWYRAKLGSLLAPLMDALAPLLNDLDAHEKEQAARTLWAGVHGITSLSTTDKLSPITNHAAGQTVGDFVTTYIAGLQNRHAH
jgi:AcrR family transcriptional regulator